MMKMELHERRIRGITFLDVGKEDDKQLVGVTKEDAG